MWLNEIIRRCGRRGAGGGVGRPGAEDDQIEHVLGRANAEDQSLMDAAVETAVEVIAYFLSEGVNTAMNRYN